MVLPLNPDDFVAVNFTVQKTGVKFVELWSYFFPASLMKGTLERLHGLPEHDQIFVMHGRILPHDFKFSRDQHRTNQGSHVTIVLETDEITILATCGERTIEMEGVPIRSRIWDIKANMMGALNVEGPEYLDFKSAKVGDGDECLEDDYTLMLYGLVKEKSRLKVEIRVKVQVHRGDSEPFDTTTNPNQTVGQLKIELDPVQDDDTEMSLTVDGFELEDDSWMVSDFVGDKATIKVRIT